MKVGEFTRIIRSIAMGAAVPAALLGEWRVFAATVSVGIAAHMFLEKP